MLSALELIRLPKFIEAFIFLLFDYRFAFQDLWLHENRHIYLCLIITHPALNNQRQASIAIQTLEGSSFAIICLNLDVFFVLARFKICLPYDCQHIAEMMSHRENKSSRVKKYTMAS